MLSASVFAAQPRIEELDPVAYRQRGRGREMREAADVRRRDDLGSPGFQRGDLVGTQPRRELRLKDGIGAGGAAAQMSVCDGRELQPDRMKDLLHAATQLE